MAFEEKKTPTELLMDALEEVEGAKNVVILIDTGTAMGVYTTGTYQEAKWMLDQAAHITMNRVFGIEPTEG